MTTRNILTTIAICAIMTILGACGDRVEDERYAKMRECNMKIAELLRSMQESPELSVGGIVGLVTSDEARLLGNWITGGAEEDAKPFDAIIEDLEDGEC